MSRLKTVLVKSIQGSTFPERIIVICLLSFLVFCFFVKEETMIQIIFDPLFALGFLIMGILFGFWTLFKAEKRNDKQGGRHAKPL